MNRGVFLDRDGVLVYDVHLLTRIDELLLLPGVSAALTALSDAGFVLVVVSNQPVVARGLATETEVEMIHVELAKLIVAAGGPFLNRFYFCPHHPNATLPAYRISCECRKPGSGMFLQAAGELDLDLNASFTVGDRITDVIAGAKVGCRTALVQTGKHLERPIESIESLDTSVQPDYICANLSEAARWILAQK